MFATSNAFACLFLFLAVFYQSCEKQMPVSKQNENSVDHSSDSGYVFDNQNRMVAQPLDADARAPEKFKFVEVRVSKVRNPKLQPVSFEVHFRPESGDEIFLGTFSLFPADNPGRFIVPTSGRLRDGGKLVLSLSQPKEVDNDMQIVVEKMRLTEQ